MEVEYLVAVIGSGPAGMSAAARAAKNGQLHILLERAPHLTHTVYKYPKRKHVMAAPHQLQVRSDLPFDAGTREDVLESWHQGVAEARVNIRPNSEVVAIAGEHGHFTISLADGDVITAANVVLATGTQGNPRKLDIPGAHVSIVQYGLDDADEHCGETVVVIGAGDSALEDALALAERNEVVLVNRGADFRKAKPANAARIASAIAGGAVRPYFQARPISIGARHIVLDTEEGETLVACDRVIARLGTVPPREMLAACGLNITDDGFPPLSPAHESSVPGLYIIGALAGYPLIKHGLKQGYEVVEHILGNGLLFRDQKRFVAKLEEAGAAEFVARLRTRIPRFAPMGIRQLCEFLLHAAIRRVAPGEIIYRDGEHTSQLYWVMEGVVALEGAGPAAAPLRFVRGDVAGAIEFCGGHARVGTARAETPALLVEADGPAMAILLRAERELRQEIDEIAIANLIALRLAPGIGAQALAELVRSARVIRLRAGDTLAEEGTADVPLYLLRKGAATVSQRSDGGEVVLSYLSAGAVIGEFAWLVGEAHGPAIRAVTAAEAVRIDGAALRRACLAMPALRTSLAEAVGLHLSAFRRDRRRQGLVQFLIEQGLGEATDALLIDNALCVGCNNCETACAETHHGLSALDRRGGARHGTLHVPSACRHCETPLCLGDCPTDSIRRAIDGAIYIDDNCTGCGHCERNCPFDAIRMAAPPERKPNLLLWMLFGWGSGPGEDRSRAVAPSPGNRHAVKCDLCHDAEAGPACVNSCPTGAAMRVNPAAFIRSTLRP